MANDIEADKIAFKSAIELARQLEDELNSLRAKGYNVGGRFDERQHIGFTHIDIALWAYKEERISLG